MTTSSGLLCDLCTEADATKFCVECAQNICNACFKIHGRQRAMQSHTVISMEEKLSSQVLMQARPAYCKTHTSEQLKLYFCDNSTSSRPEFFSRWGVLFKDDSSQKESASPQVATRLVSYHFSFKLK